MRACVRACVCVCVLCGPTGPCMRKKEGSVCVPQFEWSGVASVEWSGISGVDS